MYISFGWSCLGLSMLPLCFLYQITLPVSWEICMQVKKQQLEPDMEQQTGSKQGKEYVKAVYCHPDYLTYMHVKWRAGWSTSWNQDSWEKYQ